MNNNKYAPLILVTLLAGPVMAGVVFQVEITDHEVSPPTVELMQISAQGKKLMATLGVGHAGREGRVIYHGDKRRMVIVDDADKSYFALDEGQVAAMASQANQAMKQVNEALKNVPEDQRAAFEKMLKQRMPQAAPEGPVIEVKKTGDRAEKNGYPCERYEVWKDGLKISEIWVTDWKNLPGASDVVAAFEDMGDFVRDLTNAFSEAMGGGGGMGANFGQDILGQISNLGGFPAYSREFAKDGSLKGEFNLRSAKQQDVDPGTFEPDKTYKLRSMFGG